MAIYKDGVLQSESAYPAHTKLIDHTSHLRDGQPCSHPGCLRHLSHPCDGCGRIAGRRTLDFFTEGQTAHDAGKNMIENPYERESAAAQHWLDGWKQGWWERNKPCPVI